MKVKISDKIICIPPYVSMTWDHIAFLQSAHEEETQKFTLILHLYDGKEVRIPTLDISIIDIAFSAHSQYLEKLGAQKREESKSAHGMIQPLFGLSSEQISFPIRLGINGNGMGPAGIEGIENAFQHNASGANSPLLPKELIDKIAAIAKIMTNGDLSGFPKPEPHCNCMHCQVARSIHNLEGEEQKAEEIVTEEDLKFRSWEISQTGDNLFIVTNPIDPREQYSVFLGTPVGCTCGHRHCEHIRAVLSS